MGDMASRTPKKSTGSTAAAYDEAAPSTHAVKENETSEEHALTPAQMKVTELREALTARGLNSKGLKKDLVERLEEALSTTPDVVQVQPVSEEIKEKEELFDGAIDEIVNESENHEEEIFEPTIDNIDEHSNKYDKQIETEVDKESKPAEKESVSGPVVHIAGFVRPFTLQSAKDLVGQYGQVVGFWMDSIKSHCYVQYADAKYAQACIQGLNGLQWPQSVGKILSAESSTAEEMGSVQSDNPQVSRKRSLEDIQVEQAPMATKKARTLDELFMKTQAKPHLYYLPRTATQ